MVGFEVARGLYFYYALQNRHREKLDPEAWIIFSNEQITPHNLYTDVRLFKYANSITKAKVIYRLNKEFPVLHALKLKFTSSKLCIQLLGPS